MNDKINESNFRSHLILILMSFIALGPVIILFFNSLKNNAEIGSNPLGFPSRLAFENYFGAWETANYSTTIWNSFLISGGTVVGVIIEGIGYIDLLFSRGDLSTCSTLHCAFVHYVERYWTVQHLRRYYSNIYWTFFSLFNISSAILHAINSRRFCRGCPA